MYKMCGLFDIPAGTLRCVMGVYIVPFSADTFDKLFLLWLTCTTACRKYWEEAGKAIWFFRQGYGLSKRCQRFTGKHLSKVFGRVFRSGAE